jgi:RimJ/RimL family protein N-acetyltransferase
LLHRSDQYREWKRAVPDRTSDYEVGYKKPPKETRFKKGNKANPRGRPRGSKNLATLLGEALDTPVTVVEDGTRRQRTKRDVVIAQLVDQSAGADLRATKLLLDMLHRVERGGAAAHGDIGSSGPDADVYEQLRAKLARLALAQAAKAYAPNPLESAEPMEADPKDEENKIGAREGRSSLQPSSTDQMPALTGAPGVVIETARLRMRPLRDDDLADLVSLINNWEVARWVSSAPHPYSEADGRQWIARVQQDHATGRPRRFAIALKDTDRLIGGVGLDGSTGDDSDEPALGYWLGQPHWGNGYTREAVAAVIDYGLRTLCMTTIRAYTDPDNMRSQRVLLHCGLKQVGEIDLIEPTRHGARRAPLFRISQHALIS